MPKAEVFLAEVLQEHGYHTVALGKWHLGFCDVRSVSNLDCTTTMPKDV